MKFYETHYEDYIHSVEKYNIHPELKRTFDRFPQKLSQLKNLIVYGPSGTGKYSQVLALLKKYSPSELKYDKKITANTEKQQYIYRISDIHYEIDMSLLGCNSKLLWHEVFFQIVDIISVKQDKTGIIICKNFHLIHTELLEIFYSYIQQYNYAESNIKIKFIIITEHISFLPEQILNCSQIINIKRPCAEFYSKMILFSNTHLVQPSAENETKAETFIKGIAFHKSNQANPESFAKTTSIFNEISEEGIVNTKEIRSFPLISDAEELPKDVFNMICDNIVEIIVNKNRIEFANFRDVLYDILTYNLDVTDCVWYIIRDLIKHNHLQKKVASDVLKRTFLFLKYYNNNYRPIYHLESIMFYIINKVHNHNEL